jgi:hypothetical protein
VLNAMQERKLDELHHELVDCPLDEDRDAIEPAASSRCR